MAITWPNTSRWEAQYGAALQAYVRDGGEALLQRAYELGRQALAERHGIVELVAVHHRLLLECWTSLPIDEPMHAVQRSGAFLSEAISAYEMTHRGFDDANAALCRMHEFVEKEAKRIAYALHDGAAQLLAAVHLQLDDLARELPPDARLKVKQTRDVLDQVEEQLRALAHEIRPAVLDDLGLVPALQALGEAFARRAGIRVEVKAGQARRLPAAIETALYRAVQEALNNVRKHARARHVTVLFHDVGDTVYCSIQDDGVGFEPVSVFAQPHSGLGLLGMRERVQAIGGKVEFKAALGRGAGLYIRIPLDEASWQSKS